MDTVEDQLDPEVAQEVIALLNKKVASLRSENAQLQNQLRGSSLRAESSAFGVPDDIAQRLSEEIEYWKSELQQRPSREEVATLEGRLKKSKQRKRELEQQVSSLNTRLEELESRKQSPTVVKEEGITELSRTLDERTREKEEAIAQLESSMDTFELDKFLSGTLIELPPGHQPALMTVGDKRRFKELALQRGEDFFSINSPHGIMWVSGDRGGCVVPLPSFLYNGRSNVVESYRSTPVANHSYQFCGADETGHRCTYHGMFRCIAVVATDWKRLASIDKKFAGRFLSRTVTNAGYAQQEFVSFFENLYRAGVLRVDCAVLKFEHFDHAAVEQIPFTKEAPKIIKMSSPRNRDKRPGDQHDQGRGSGKKPRLKK